MADCAQKDILGVGIYTPSEAALYARIRTQTLARWVHGNRRGKSAIHAQFEDDASRAVTFLDFVQALAVREIRHEFKLPLSKIREAVDLARDKYGIEYPFAMPHRTFLFGQQILIEIREREIVQASGRHKRQGVMRKVAELYMEDLTFTPEGLAATYLAFKHGKGKVVMDPTRLFGQPLVASCGYPALTLAHAYRTEGSVRGAARAYDVPETDIKLALRYNDYLRGPMAA